MRAGRLRQQVPAPILAACTLMTNPPRRCQFFGTGASRPACLQWPHAKHRTACLKHTVRLLCTLNCWRSGHQSTVSLDGTSWAHQQLCWPASACCSARTCARSSVLLSVQHVCKSAQPNPTHSMLNILCCWVAVARLRSPLILEHMYTCVLAPGYYHLGLQLVRYNLQV
jgi:hypothetical protein